MLGILCLVAAVALLAYNYWDDWRAGQSVADIQDALEEAKKSRDAEKLAGLSQTKADKDIAMDADAAAAEDETSNEGNTDTSMATVEIDGYEYIGTLSIPGYGLELPIMAEWNYPGLRIAPARYCGSIWNDDLVICGHNYERHFGNLKNLEEGDSITFKDVDGNVFVYEVKEVVILQPTAVEEMISREAGEWDLTLFTCTLGGQTRVTVRCVRIKE
ncbi:MAG: sortase [Lachnospiraceae bacterium]|nr:sortase [Lachnospiraceae bacterium]